MLIKPSYWRKLLLLPIIILFVSACQKSPVQENNECGSHLNPCLTLKSEFSEITFDTSILLVENLYKISIKTNEQIESLALLPLNMPMGKIPLFLRKSEHGYSSKLNLGMCAEPVMLWQLIIRYQTGALETHSVTSYWSQSVFQKLHNRESDQ